ncbi:copper radical oxidase [Ramaria rubella]|nr:copper radical oxidase [Ramaria rubella]
MTILPARMAFTGLFAFGLLSLPIHSFAEHIHAVSHRNLHGDISRRATTLPGNWTLQGCFTDNPAARTLTGSSFTNTTGMTQELCTAFCDTGSFIFSGVEFAQECYCGNEIENGGVNTTITDCSTPCVGNPQEFCGGASRLDLFSNGKTPPPPPITLPSFGLWDSLGCYNDSVNARTLTVGVGVDGPMTVQLCLDECVASGFPLGGLEFAAQCFCDVQIQNSGAPVTDGGCNMPCAGNSSEFCGGPNRLNVYNFTGVITTPPTPPAGGGGAAPAGPPPPPVTQGLPAGWKYSGCYVDDAFGRVLSDELPDNANTTVELCVETCSAANFTVAGIEFAVQCFCGNEMVNGAVIAPDQNDCNMLCGGNSSEACGGPNRLSVYSSQANVTLLPVPVVQNTSLPGNWQYQGCLTDDEATRVFPYQLFFTTNNSAEVCLNQCAAFGYPAAGMEFGDECWCGDVSDIQAAGATLAPATDCSVPCTGDPIHLCGGAQRLQLYEWVGTPLNLWHTPEVTGFYEFLVGGLTVPLIATLGINNKVTFLEKFGTGPPNSTGAYELDLSLVDDFGLTWREMHVQTDVFCSGAVVLPDKAGRVLNVGGWSLDSTFGVRLYTPSGSPGVNGTTDWEENNEELRLQNGRWYPGSMVMANGSVLVVGGEAGSNGSPVPTLETLPTQPGGNTTVFLDFLQRTDPNNLYPFLMVMPQGGVFIIYYNEARILDETTFATIKEFPIIPGAVTGGGGGRTYPLEGTSVILPQHAPYTDPVEVLTCGGSTPGPGLALDNCVLIQPEAENATWILERMPFKRVMTCMTALPDGTYLITNGANQGVAGFGLATDPELTALLYDPTLAIGQRISILNTTIVARLYHSESILLQDGRVLISGSDPNPDGGPFPEEYRIEVYVPPYLASGQIQPTFNVTETDWQYGQQYQITNVVTHQNAGTRISLLAAVSSTHGNSFGQRTLFPDFTCAGSTCTITAPPNAHISPPGWFQLFVLDGSTPSWSQWVRIGGDPAELGNWPQFPDFTTPGI